jgi:hypothetical protein
LGCRRKESVFGSIETEDLLPTAAHALKQSGSASAGVAAAVAVKPSPTRVARPQSRTTLIPNSVFSIAWAGRIQRHRAIWEELQFHLNLSDHPNAISVLFRVLVELSVQNYIDQIRLSTVGVNDALAKRVLRVAEDLHKHGKIDQYFELLRKFPQADSLLSADTLNRYVHSPNFAPSPDHLRAL